MNRSFETVHAPAETNRSTTPLEGLANHYWDRADVLSRVDSTMRSAFADVHKRAEHEQVSLRDAAHLTAVERVADACRQRGWV